MVGHAHLTREDKQYWVPTLPTALRPATQKTNPWANLESESAETWQQPTNQRARRLSSSPDNERPTKEASPFSPGSGCGPSRGATHPLTHSLARSLPRSLVPPTRLQPLHCCVFYHHPSVRGFVGLAPVTLRR